MKIGCSPITWRRQAPLEESLREIAAVGYEGAPAGYQPEKSPEEVAKLYRSFGLKPAPGYLGANYHDRAERLAIRELAKRHADWSAALGCTEIFVAESCFADRFAVAGHETANRADRMTDDGYRAAADALDDVGLICRQRGVTACFHNHAGSYLETRDEIEKLLALTDSSLVAIGLDTGHLAYAGADVIDFTAAHAQRIKAVHMKDVHGAILAEVRRRKLGYHEAQEIGIWAELGEGTIDFGPLFEHLRAAGFAGWTIVEIDQTTRTTPRDSIQACFDYLKRVASP